MMLEFQIRNAEESDIPAIQMVRHAVKENRLSDPSKVTDEDVRNYLFDRGQGWVATVEKKVVGFAIGDLQDPHIWALFVLPKMEGCGIGRALHDRMINWMFDQGVTTLWLSTDPGTRAEQFYRRAGWIDTGMTPSGELRFELSASSAK